MKSRGQSPLGYTNVSLPARGGVVNPREKEMRATSLGQQVPYILGLDLGVGSVGWAALEIDGAWEHVRPAGRRRSRV